MNPNEKLGDKKFKAAQENITTGIFQWSKDYSSGASNFSEALKYYQSSNCYEKALKTLKELIICNEKLMDNWAVARNYEEMLDIYIKNYPQTPLETLKQTANSGFLYFRMAESIDKGLVMLGRIAKELIKKGQVNEGVEILKSAYQSASEDQKSFKKKQLFHQIIQVYLENEIYSEIERMYHDLVKKDQTGDNSQNGLIILIMIIIQHEAKRAEKEMYQLSNIIPNFLETDECEAADELIKAYKKGDSETFLKWTTKAAVTSIFPVAIITKLRNVKVPAAISKQQPEEAQKENLKQLLF